MYTNIHMQSRYLSHTSTHKILSHTNTNTIFSGARKRGVRRILLADSRDVLFQVARAHTHEHTRTLTHTHRAHAHTFSTAYARTQALAHMHAQPGNSSKKLVFAHIHTHTHTYVGGCVTGGSLKNKSMIITLATTFYLKKLLVFGRGRSL
jgi:hypothetical protein